jgi:predicted nucleic acid-binding protein
MDYLDTSVIVAALANEVATSAAQAWLASHSADIHISDWVVTEVSSALSMKVRTGELTVDRRAAKLAHFRQMLADSFTLLSLTPAHFQAAALLADQHQLGLRAGDALHLAFAADLGATLFTLDKRLAEAGKQIGASVHVLGH